MHKAKLLFPLHQPNKKVLQACHLQFSNLYCNSHIKQRVSSTRRNSINMFTNSKLYSSPNDGIESRNISTEKEIEIEQKFAISHLSTSFIERKLKSLGFQPCGPMKRFTDTYIDVLNPTKISSSYDKASMIGTLTVKYNHWFRYRELHTEDGDESDKKGAFQLKRPPVYAAKKKDGNNKDEENNDETTISQNLTIYEELTNELAIQAVQSILHLEDANEESSRNKGDPEVESAVKIPKVLQKYNLVPFASFETRRSSWTLARSSKDKHISRTQPINDLKVDIDGTDFGYMIGEVEIIVRDESEINEAKDHIQKLILELTSINDDTNNDTKSIGKTEAPAYGKLETFMMEHCPEHYHACVKSGSM